MKTPARLFLAMCVLWTTSCVHHYKPSDSRPFDGQLKFNSSNQVSLVNTQDSGKTATVKLGVHKWRANLRDCTDVAIAIADKALQKQGMHVSAGASRQLKMSIRAVDTHVGFVKIDSQVILDVQTGDGYSATFFGLNNSAMAAVITRQLDGAIMRAVSAMLKDPRIVSYLTK